MVRMSSFGYLRATTVKIRYELISEATVPDLSVLAGCQGCLVD
jgi:hypothetical protein